MARRATVTRSGSDAENDPDGLVVHFDPPDQGADDVALGRPIRRFQTVLDDIGEGLDLPDDEREGAGLLRGVPDRRRGRFGGVHPRPQRAQTRFELRSVEDALGVAVDQPVDAAPELGELAFDRHELLPARADPHALQAPLMFTDHPDRVREDATDLVPDRGVQLLDGHHAGIAPALAAEPPSIRSRAPVVVIVLLALRLVEPLVGAAESVSALAADEQPLQQILRTTAMLADGASTFGELLLDCFEQSDLDEGRDGDRDLLVRGNIDPATRAFGDAPPPVGGAQRRLPGDDPALPEGGPADVGGIGQQVPDGAAAPAGQPGRTGNPRLEQPAADRAQRDALPTDPPEDRADHLGLVLGHVETGNTTPGLPTDIAVAEGRASHDAGDAGARQVAFAPTASLQHLGALVLGEHALELEQQVIFRRPADRPVKEDDLRAGASELLDENRLVGVVAGETIGGVDVEPVDDRHRRQVT